MVDDHLMGLAVVPAAAGLAVRPFHRGELLTLALGRERDAVADVGAGITVGVDQHVIGGAVLELIGQGRRQRIDVEDQNRLTGVTGLLENVDIGDVGARVTVR